MKRILLILLFMGLSYNTVLANPCFDGCTPVSTVHDFEDGPQEILIPGTNCKIQLWYEATEYNCNGETYYGIQVITWIFVSDNSCPTLSLPTEMIETAIGIMLGDPSQNPFDEDFYPSPGNCVTNVKAWGHACWYIVTNETDPNGMTRRQYAACSGEQQCCRPFEVCVDLLDNVTVTPGEFLPVTCDNPPCFQLCP